MCVCVCVCGVCVCLCVCVFVCVVCVCVFCVCVCVFVCVCVCVTEEFLTGLFRFQACELSRRRRQSHIGGKCGSFAKFISKLALFRLINTTVP